MKKGGNGILKAGALCISRNKTTKASQLRNVLLLTEWMTGTERTM
jgi:hypothetical protein